MQEAYLVITVPHLVKRYLGDPMSCPNKLRVTNRCLGRRKGQCFLHHRQAVALELKECLIFLYDQPIIMYTLYFGE